VVFCGVCVFCGVFVCAYERVCAWWCGVFCVCVVCLCMCFHLVCMWCVVFCACLWCICVCGVCVFLKMKEHLAGKRHADDDALQHAVVDWLNRLATYWYDVGIIKLVSCYDKCLNVESDVCGDVGEGVCYNLLIHFLSYYRYIFFNCKTYLTFRIPLVYECSSLATLLIVNCATQSLFPIKCQFIA
jgi:hypothetical protein